MIRKNLLFIKMSNIKSSSKILFDRYMQKFMPERETCPVCGARGCCHIHAYYDRTVTDFISGRKITFSICIMRVICDSCHHTHAILPDHIIPYGTHGLFFVLSVLSDHFFRLDSIAGICEKYDISEKLFYKWKGLFLKHKKLWLGDLLNNITSAESFMESLIHESYSGFVSKFISTFTFSFLQAHKNPSVTFRNTAGYCQKVFIPDYFVV